MHKLPSVICESKLRINICWKSTFYIFLSEEYFKRYQSFPLTCKYSNFGFYLLSISLLVQKYKKLFTRVFVTDTFIFGYLIAEVLFIHPFFKYPLLLSTMTHGDDS